MRTIKFRAWDEAEHLMRKVEAISFVGRPAVTVHYNPVEKIPLDNLYLMQFTGLLDKNGYTEVYEGDIIDELGIIKGNIYESPQIYQEGVDCIIEGMGTKIWRDTESIAMGRGCKYAE